MPIRIGTRLDALRALERQTGHEISCALRRDRDTTGLQALREYLAEAIAQEERGAAMIPFEKPRQDRVGLRLAQLGVSSHDVKVWAYGQGLVDAVKRGRIAAELVEAYAAATHMQRVLADEHANGNCAECDARMVKPGVWHRATIEQRAQWKSWGFARFSGRGLCTRCYVRLKDHGELERHASLRIRPGEGMCGRCGMADIVTDDDGLCPDCAEFVANDAYPSEASA